VLLGDPAVESLLHTLLLDIDAARDFEIEIPRAAFQRALFAAQLELRILGGPAPSALIGKLARQNRLLERGVLARLAFRLGDEHLGLTAKLCLHLRELRLVCDLELRMQVRRERLGQLDLSAAVGAGNRQRRALLLRARSFRSAQGSDRLDVDRSARGVARRFDELVSLIGEKKCVVLTRDTISADVIAVDVRWQ
jgi:hypothetical protein